MANKPSDVVSRIHVDVDLVLYTQDLLAHCPTSELGSSNQV